MKHQQQSLHQIEHLSQNPNRLKPLQNQPIFLHFLVSPNEMPHW